MKRDQPPPSHAELAAAAAASPPEPQQQPPPQAPPPPGAHGDAPPMSMAPQRAEQVYETLSGSFLLLSLKRAFRLQINPNEVLASERKALRHSVSHIVDPEHQAFLAWRRSVLLVVVAALVPLTVLRFIEGLQAYAPTDGMRAFQLIPAFAEAVLLLVAFWQMFNWTRWTSQRRVLFVAWALYFIAPNLMFLYPYQVAFDDVAATAAREAAKAAREYAQMGDIRLSTTSKKSFHFAIGMAFGLKALVLLAPKAISIMPGLIRASVVTKLLFPGSAAPGYLILMAAPLYALFAFMIVLLPYQVTASAYFVFGLVMVMGAQIFIAMTGRTLITPLSRVEASQRVSRYWKAYIGILLAGAAFVVVGLYDFVKVLDYGITTVFSTIMSFVANVLLLTLIGTDAIIANLRRLADIRQEDAAREALRQESEDKLRLFCR